MSELSPKQQQAICLLADGAMSKDVAETVGVTPETVSVWKRDPEFQACLNRLKYELMDVARDTMRRKLREVSESLIDLAVGAKNEETRRKACLDVLCLMDLNEPQVYGWGIGKTDPEDIVTAQGLKEGSRQLLKAMASPYVDS